MVKRMISVFGGGKPSVDSQTLNTQERGAVASVNPSILLERNRRPRGPLLVSRTGDMG